MHGGASDSHCHSLSLFTAPLPPTPSAQRWKRNLSSWGGGGGSGRWAQISSRALGGREGCRRTHARSTRSHRLLLYCLIKTPCKCQRAPTEGAAPARPDPRRRPRACAGTLPRGSSGRGGGHGVSFSFLSPPGNLLPASRSGVGRKRKRKGLWPPPWPPPPPPPCPGAQPATAAPCEVMPGTARPCAPTGRDRFDSGRAAARPRRARREKATRPSCCRRLGPLLAGLPQLSPEEGALSGALGAGRWAGGCGARPHLPGL